MDNVHSAKEDETVANNLPELSSNLSKRQLKRLQKREKWLERKNEKRLRERAKAREKRAYARANNLNLGPSRKFLKKSTMAVSSCKLMVTIDLSFDDLMIDKDIAKLTKQILRCYTLNRRATAPMQFSLTSFTGRSRADMEKHNGYQHWDVKFHTDSYINVYPKDKIVYLTSESENVIDRVNHEWIYVIGGLVDHNAHKGICYKLATEAGIRHGRLPLDKFLQMKARKVLTIDHVFEILLRVTEGNTWQEAFLKVLPERKNAQPIVPVQFKQEEIKQESRDSEPVDVNSAIVPVQFKQESRDPEPVDVNSAIVPEQFKQEEIKQESRDPEPVDVNGAIVPVQFKHEEIKQESCDPEPVDVNSKMLVNVNTTMQIDVSNTILNDINDIYDKESDNGSESNIESKKILEEHPV